MIDTNIMKEFRVGDYRDHIKKLLANPTPMVKISTKRRKKRAKSNKHARTARTNLRTDLY